MRKSRTEIHKVTIRLKSYINVFNVTLTCWFRTNQVYFLLCGTCLISGALFIDSQLRLLDPTMRLWSGVGRLLEGGEEGVKCPHSVCFHLLSFFNFGRFSPSIPILTFQRNSRRKQTMTSATHPAITPRTLGSNFSHPRHHNWATKTPAQAPAVTNGRRFEARASITDCELPLMWRQDALKAINGQWSVSLVWT